MPAWRPWSSPPWRRCGRTPSSLRRDVFLDAGYLIDLRLDVLELRRPRNVVLDLLRPAADPERRVRRWIVGDARRVGVLQIEEAGRLHLASERAHGRGVDLPRVVAGRAHVLASRIRNCAVLLQCDRVLRAHAETWRALQRDLDGLWRRGRPAPPPHPPHPP